MINIITYHSLAATDWYARYDIQRDWDIYLFSPRLFAGIDTFQDAATRRPASSLRHGDAHQGIIKCRYMLDKRRRAILYHGARREKCHSSAKWPQMTRTSTIIYCFSCYSTSVIFTVARLPSRELLHLPRHTPATYKWHSLPPILSTSAQFARDSCARDVSILIFPKHDWGDWKAFRFRSYFYIMAFSPLQKSCKISIG